VLDEQTFSSTALMYLIASLGLLASEWVMLNSKAVLEALFTG